MKRKLIRILLLCLIMTLALPVVDAMAANQTRYVNTDDGGALNLREEANKNSRIVARIPYRQDVLIYSFNKNKTWAYIETSKPAGCKEEGSTVKGWVMVKYLSKTKPPKKKPNPVPDEPTLSDINAAAKQIKFLDEPFDAVIVTRNPANFVHLRWFHNTSAGYWSQYLCGTQVRVIAQSQKWSQVIIQEEDSPAYVGFILSDNVAALEE